MYRSKIKTQKERNPCLTELYDFLSQPGSRRCRSRIVSLDFVTHDKSPTSRIIQPTDLLSELECPQTPPQPGQILIVEDITPEVVETLGGALGLDPRFFASYISQAWRKLRAQSPQTCALPSRERRQSFVPLYYHRTVVAHGLEPDAAQFVRTCNHQRKLFVLPPIKGERVGLAQHACAVLKTGRADGRWIGIILVDPPLQNDYTQLRSRETLPTSVSLKPFLGGCEDFEDDPIVDTSSPAQQLELGDGDGTSTRIDRRGMLGELVHHWTTSAQPLAVLHACTPPSLQALAYLPLRIVAAEWVNYRTLVEFSVKEHEWVSGGRSSWMDELEGLDKHLRNLQTWRRRVLASQQKMRQIARFLAAPVPGVESASPRCNNGICCGSRNSISNEPSDLEAAWAALRADYAFLGAEIGEHGARVESLVAVVTSGMALLEGRRSLAETANVSRLTLLAFFFLPLSFVATLFSMGDINAPGGSRFWVYWAVALPLTFIVTLLAQTRLAVHVLRSLRQWVRER
ncbi:hypothetical protein CC80DRAFT_292748 [Byssothecium circinans]|uniref:Cora-domain-containing protein n=1 Tax=Byssothecium circinans TaxID=147558 RepID=A0A6A5U693_9PLEO|nr:hypothetical protein CC80DRAFT_292748 [Byssothecium circinans]